MTGASTRPSLGRSLLAGLAAGAAAAIVASLVSLPLRSPDDIFLNTGSITIGALLLGLASGGLWWLSGGSRAAILRYLVPMEVAFILVVAGTVAIELIPDSPLEGAPFFVIPLAAIVFALVEVLIPLLTRLRIPLALIAAPVAAAAVAVGIGFAGQGDAASGELSLPDLPPVTVANTNTSTNEPSAGSAATSLPSGVLRPSDVAGGAFTIVSSESAATYTVREKLADLPLPNDAVGRTSQISGTIFLDGRPSKITVDLRTLTSDQPRRDRFIRADGGLPSNRFPFAEFTVQSLDDLPDEYQSGEIVRRDVTGTMKIRDVERPFTFSTESRLTNDGLQIRGTGKFTWSDFQIPPPNIRGLVQVENEIRLEVLLIAKREGSG